MKGSGLKDISGKRGNRPSGWQGKDETDCWGVGRRRPYHSRGMKENAKKLGKDTHVGRVGKKLGGGERVKEKKNL